MTSQCNRLRAGDLCDVSVVNSEREGTHPVLSTSTWQTAALSSTTRGAISSKTQLHMSPTAHAFELSRVRASRYVSGPKANSLTIVPQTSRGEQPSINRRWQAIPGVQYLGLTCSPMSRSWRQGRCRGTWRSPTWRREGCHRPP